MLTDSTLFLIAGFVLNFISAFIIIRFIYYPKKSGHNFIFTFLAFNAIVYFIMGLFTSIELSIGAGFGLFALFSILRYRTETVPIREMTYLFVMVALPILNSVLFESGEYSRIIAINLMLIIVIWILENGWGFKSEPMQKEVLYEKIEFVKAGRKEEMIADLKQRTGLDVFDVEVDRIDFLRDTAEIKIFYFEDSAEKQNIKNKIGVSEKCD
ncbi:DUF4956 domain-containing protein [Methanomicrobium antiquum]|uniref:DUF4956 domain-containing protein n=1 Tax=Methanomicrobium antiquum TaxID=487686 RepID=A0AAF0FQ27_9EURY|nr:DUF4956 domain-containing protein [Methanomicrobium antiquum]WFN36554.1 DUF4956 domain-containing protein [Methanomicrobium antiquum]